MKSVVDIRDYSADNLISLEKTPVFSNLQESFSNLIVGEMGALAFLVLAKKD